MSLSISNWERPLLDRACAALTSSFVSDRLDVSASTLERAYRYCEALTARHSRTFYLASALLPREKRRAVRALYAFCRVSDDIVDRSQGNSREALARWRERALSAHPPAGDPVALAWADTRARYCIPWTYSEQLIDGVARDLTYTRYDTFEELSEYCYGVACTVGLMSMHIVGFSDMQAIPHAIKLGVALQLTNILRDIDEDRAAGRVYLPRQELAAFGLAADTLEAGRPGAAWRAFLAFQIERTRQLYTDAWPGIGLLHKDGRLAIGAAARLYEAILDDIEAHDADVFSRRAHVSAWGKLRRLPAIWRQIERFS
jgi:15-cis-phytoene synthase